MRDVNPLNAAGLHHAFANDLRSKRMISSRCGWPSINGANSGRISQLIFACGKLRRSDDNAGNAMTMSPSALGLMSRIFLYISDIGREFYAMPSDKAIRIR